MICFPVVPLVVAVGLAFGMWEGPVLVGVEALVAWVVLGSLLLLVPP